MDARTLLRTARLSVGLSSSDLSRLVGMRDKYISAIETRLDARPSPECAMRIDAALRSKGASLPENFAIELAFLGVPTIVSSLHKAAS